MELFYSGNTDGRSVTLDEEETRHCVRVLRHRKGDGISVIDGAGRLLDCRLVSDSGKEAVAEILGITEDWGGHPYRLEMAVCPTKKRTVPSFTPKISSKKVIKSLRCA